jgi:hypothetical protein
MLKIVIPKSTAGTALVKVQLVRVENRNALYLYVERFT